MAESIQKLQPDRDLACYFQRPSAIAALSSTSPTGFTVSGTWREQFDWAVIEWNRDNTFEHPLLRNLPDGDLSGLTLSYQESRTNCIPLDSNLYPTVDWPYLRFWMDSPQGDVFRRVRISDYATPVTGEYTAAKAVFALLGTLTTGDVIELAWDPFASEHYNYTIVDGDTAASAVVKLSRIINSLSTTVQATVVGAQISLMMTSAAQGVNANRVGAYGNVSGACSEVWEPQSQQFSGGSSPTVWQVTVPFNALTDAATGEIFAANSVRKMRWTYSADLQPGAFVRSEFQVVVSSWTVTGSNRIYSVAGPGSRRIEDDSASIQYSGTWSPSSANHGNFSGGSIAYTTTQGSGLTCSYLESGQHQLLLGTRRAASCDFAQVVVDGGAPQVINCNMKDDVLVRISLGTFGAGQHSVQITYTGASGNYFYFDFLEIAYPSQVLPDLSASSTLTLATDWDTDHSIALPPERSAWLMSKLGFLGRANHYQGALWFFEMTRAGQVYASATVTFGGISAISAQTTLTVSSAAMTHLHLQGDTPATVASAFALQINNGSTAIWAAASGNVLTISARAMGVPGNAVTVSVGVAQANGSTFTAVTSGSSLQGGIDGSRTGVAFQDAGANLGWRTDLSASPRINRAARDWSTSFFRALHPTGLRLPAPSARNYSLWTHPRAGMAQRYYNNGPTAVNTPAIQTNFPQRACLLAGSSSGNGANDGDRRAGSLSAVWRNPMVVLHRGTGKSTVLRRLYD